MDKNLNGLEEHDWIRDCPGAMFEFTASVPLAVIDKKPSEFNAEDVRFEPIELGICFVTDVNRLIKEFEAVDRPMSPKFHLNSHLHSHCSLVSMMIIESYHVTCEHVSGLQPERMGL